jgi:hypothetical protein
MEIKQMVSSRFIKISRIVVQDLPNNNSRNSDLREEDLQQRLDSAVEAVRNAVAILESVGMDGGEAALKVISIVKNEVEGGRDSLVGGLGDGKKDHIFDEEELARGREVELEHTNDVNLAEEIAKDHLMELPDYYTRLDRMEAEGENELTR